MSRRYRLYPEPAESPVLVMHCDHARFVWNLALEQWNEWRPGRSHTPGYVEQARQLTEARGEFDWLAAGSTVVQQGALRDFQRAKINFYRRTHGRPMFRSRRDRTQGFLVRDAQVRPCLNPRYAQTLIPKVGWVRFRITRALPEQLTSARVTVDRSGRWHVSFTATQTPVALRPGPRLAFQGVDRGVTVSAATALGKMHRAPGLRPGEAARLLRLERQSARQRIARKKAGRGKTIGTRETRTYRKIARIHARLADRRTDWVEQTSTHLVRTAQVLVFEDLHTKAMTASAKGTIEKPGTGVAAKSGLNRGILANSWANLARRCQEKATATPNCRYVEVPAAYTSQTCPAPGCGHISAENRKSQAVFRCQKCSYTANADTVGAINIRERGVKLASAAGNCGGSPSSQGTSPG